MGGMGKTGGRLLISSGISLTVLAVLAWVVLSGRVGAGLPTAADGGTGPSPTAAAPGGPSPTSVAPTSASIRTPTVGPKAPPRQTGGKPGPANTGVPPGTRLTVVNGDRTFDRSGVYADLDIHGFVRVSAKNVTIRNTIVRGGPPKCNSSVVYVTSAAASLVMEDSEIAPSYPNACLDGVWAQHATLTRMNIHGAVDGVKAYDDTTVQDSWIHDLGRFASDPNQNGGPTHNDAVQTYVGNQHIVLRHNNFALTNKDNATYQVTQDGGAVSTDLHVENNWLDGGGCTLNFSHNGGPTPMTGIYVVNNRFGRHSYYNCPILVSTQTTLSQNSGNVWDDTGQPVPPPQRHD